MPQMKPMNWIILFLYFLIMFLITNNNLYFFNYKNFISKYKNNNNLIYKKFNYKW